MQVIYIKVLSPWAASVVIVPKKADPVKPHKQQSFLVLDYRSLK